jgi:superfamily II DNA/RNA helicase
LVLFTERIETLKFLQTELAESPWPGELMPSRILHGQIARRGHSGYGRRTSAATHSPLRLLIASDVASEGLNLHYQSHRLIHFDISWSLMVFQQRNGRVDRYGQTPGTQDWLPANGAPATSAYGATLRYLEILIDKDEQAAKNIGDPSAFMGLYDEELEVAKVAAAIEIQYNGRSICGSIGQRAMLTPSRRSGALHRPAAR